MFDERRHRTRKWTDTQLIEAAKIAVTINQLGTLLGLKSESAVHRTIPKHLKRLGIDCSRFIGRANSGNRLKGRWNKYTLEQILVENSPYATTGTAGLKKRLLGEKILENRCYECSMGPQWNDKKLVLQIDHINGNRNDNRIENLRILCPNCHSQTSTYSGKNAATRGSKYV